MVEKLMAEDPSIFDYDSQYEQMQKLRDQKVAEQKEADKEKKVVPINVNFINKISSNSPNTRTSWWKRTRSASWRSCCTMSAPTRRSASRRPAISTTRRCSSLGPTASRLRS